MPDPNPPTRTDSLQDVHNLAVDFINNTLPLLDPFFVDPPVRYDPSSGRYVGLQGLNDANMATATAQGPELMVRPKDESIDKMKFWNGKFDPAKAKFISTVQEPKKRSESQFDIRKPTSWDGMYAKLELARGMYTKETGFRGTLRRVGRKIADNTQPEHTKVVSGILQFIPDIDYATPVLGVVEIILQVCRRELQEPVDTFSNDPHLFRP